MNKMLPRIFDYQSPSPRSANADGSSKMRRLLYCMGLPLIGFVLGYDLDHRGDGTVMGLVMAIGSFMIAFALPTRE